jgi:biopolymer transport protein ExbD
MSKFKKKQGNAQPAISTASLPDIVFMLLFFFMVVTKMRDTELKVVVNTPQASELTKLEKKTLVNFIFIGRPTEKLKSIWGTKPRIQLGDKFSTTDDIPLFLAKHKESVPESQRQSIISSLKIDNDVTMGLVGDVKTSLRKAGQLKVNYSAKKRERTK